MTPSTDKRPSEQLRLTAQEEIALTMAVRAGDHSALARMVDATVPVARSIARQFAHSGVGRDDLLSIALGALAEAARGFDPTRGARFATYARLIVRQRIIAAVRAQRGPCRFPRLNGALVRRVSQAVDELRDALGREPSDDEVASLVGISAPRIHTVRAGWASSISLDETVHPDGALLSELFADERATMPDASLEQEERLAQLRHAIAALPDRERKILEMRHGLAGGREHTFWEIAGHIGVTKERVRQIAELTLVRLRRAMTT